MLASSSHTAACILCKCRYGKHPAVCKQTWRSGHDRELVCRPDIRQSPWLRNKRPNYVTNGYNFCAY